MRHFLLLAGLLLGGETCRSFLRLALLHLLHKCGFSFGSLLGCDGFGQALGFLLGLALRHFLLLACLLLGSETRCFFLRLALLHLLRTCGFSLGSLRGCCVTLDRLFGLTRSHFLLLAGLLPGQLRRLVIRLGLLHGAGTRGVFRCTLLCRSGLGLSAGVVFGLA